MGNHFFTAFRTNGLPTIYPSHKTPVTADVLEAGLIFAAVILFASLLLVLPGIHGIKGKLGTFLKMFIGVFITASIFLCNFGQEWEVAHVHTLTQYRAGLVEEIDATIEVKIGLRSVNVTLLADGETVVFNSSGVEIRERINYNERFSWDNLGFTQGRAGFGPNAGKFNQEFRAGQFKGLPYPILWVAEYFTIDGEGIRWGRFYRQAGYYTHICMWLAFPCWILSMVMMHMVVRYGAYMSIFTAVVLFCANILYATIRNPNDLIIPLGDQFLEFTWGWCFILNIITAVMCLIIGVIIFIIDLRASDKISEFFGVDTLRDYDEIYSVQDVKAADPGSGNGTVSQDDIYEDTETSVRPPATVRQFRKRSTALTKRFQKNPKLLSGSSDIELTRRQRQYASQEPRQPSVPEEPDVFQSGGANGNQGSFQYRSGSGPVDNNMTDDAFISS